MRPARRFGDSFTFGGRVPYPVGLLLSVIVVASILGALLPGVRELAALVPAAILEGQLWRVLAWAFVETHPIDLVFACLVLWWLGADLSFAWGARRFFAVYAGLAVGASVVTTLVALLSPELGARGAYLGTWPVVAALTLGWGLLNPDRQINLYMVLPVTGRMLAWITVGGTLLYALFTRSIGPYVPHLAAEALIFGYLRLPRRRRGAGFRFRPFEKLRRNRFKVIRADRDPDRDKPRWLN